MKFFKKHWLYFALAGILVLYAVTRLYHLTLLPIFTDEAIYIRWSQIAKDDAMWRFISLTDGKQPMYVWIAMILLRLIHDPLTAGRLVSVIAGLLSVIGIYLLAREMFKNAAIGVLSSLLYVLYPFSLVYDKLALYDSLVAMLVIWASYVTVLFARHVRLDIGLILGMVIGCGLLTKSNTQFTLILLPFSLLLWKSKKDFTRERLLKWTSIALIALVISLIMYSVLRLSPFYHIIGEKNLTFIYSFSDWIKNPFAYVFGNLKGLIEWLLVYLTIPFFVLVLASFVVNKKNIQEKLLLFIWFIVPFMALAFFGKVIYPRFILFMTMPLLILGAYTLWNLFSIVKINYLKVLLFGVFTLMFFVTDYNLLVNPAAAAIPNADREQFLTGWPSGYGVKETVSFLETKAANEKIQVATEGTFGLMPYSLEMYLYKNPNIKVTGFWPVGDLPPVDLQAASEKMPVYVVFYQPCPSCEDIGLAPKTWHVTKEFQLTKAKDTYYTVYRLDPR